MSKIIGKAIDFCIWFSRRTSTRFYEKDFFGTIIEIIGYRYKPELLITFEELMIYGYGPGNSVIYVSERTLNAAYVCSRLNADILPALSPYQGFALMNVMV